MSQDVQCQVESVAPLNESVYRVLLRPSVAVNFLAGQYLLLCLTADDKRPFSIASTPDDELLELHVGAPIGDAKAMELIHFLQVNRAISVELPFGEAYLRQPQQRPLILVIGGTGFSYACSILTELFKQPQRHAVYLYWGGRASEALYMQAAVEQWAAKHEHFHFVPVVEAASSSWSGKVGKVHQAVLEDFVSLSDYEVYVAGPFSMAGVVRSEFLQQGLAPQHLFGDAYAFI
jgi:aquacobalamin reductase/NAD(P)H-flavin reductase